MGNTISEELENEPNETWWSSRQPETQITQNTQPSSSTALPNKNTTQNHPEETPERETVFITKTETTELEEQTIDASGETSSAENRLIETILESTNASDDDVDILEHRKRNAEKLEQFRSELANKHLARRQAIAERSREILFLREELAKHKKENEDLKEALNAKKLEEQTRLLNDPDDTSWKERFEKLQTENEEMRSQMSEQCEELNRHKDLHQQNHELRLNIAEVQQELQQVNAQVVAFEKERQDYQTHVSAMKDVVKVSKQLLEIREHQLEEVSGVLCFYFTACHFYICVCCLLFNIQNLLLTS